MLLSICNRIVVSSLNQLVKSSSTRHLHQWSPLPRLLQNIKAQRRPMTIDSAASEASHKASDINHLQPLSQDSLQEPVETSSSNLEEGRWQDIGEAEEEEVFDEFKGISLQRGQTGVFDIEELVDILHLEKLGDITVIAVDPEIQYVDHMVISTGKSARQMTAVANFIRRIFKERRSPSDSLPVIEGKDNKDWIAMDLGNIALHIFSKKARAVYDLETLWTCGSKYDDLSVTSNEEEDNLSVLMKQHFPSQTKLSP